MTHDAAHPSNQCANPKCKFHTRKTTTCRSKTNGKSYCPGCYAVVDNIAPVK